jgi:hypothetical protein
MYDILHGSTVIMMLGGRGISPAKTMILNEPRFWLWLRRCKMSKIKTRTYDVSNYLEDEVDIAAYLQAVIEDGDPALLAAALDDIARTRGMSQLARDTGLSRESL